MARPMQQQQAQQQAMAGRDARRRRPVFDRAYFCSIGLSDQGLDPRKAHAWDRIVTKQDLMDEFGWDGDRGCIKLTQARTIKLPFLKTLKDKVYPHRGSNFCQGSIAFARGAIATRRGLQVDWATFAFDAQFKGRYGQDRRRADPVGTAASPPRQGGGEVASNAPDLAREATCQENRAMEVEVEHETQPQGMLVCAGQELEARADEPGSGPDSEMNDGVSYCHERKNRLYDEIGNWVKHFRMIAQEGTEGMAQGSGPDENSQAAQDLEASDRELGQVGPGPQVDLNEETHMDVSGGQESASLPLPQSWTDPGFEDIRPLASRPRVQHPEPRPQPVCPATSRDVEGMAKESGPDVKSQPALDMGAKDHEPGPSPLVDLIEEMQVDVSCSKESDCLALAQFRDPGSENIRSLASRPGVQPLEPRQEPSKEGTQAVHVQPPESRPEPACNAASPCLREDPRLLELSRIMFNLGRSSRRDVRK